MARDFHIYADDVLDAIGRIESYISGMSKASFTADLRTVDAVTRCLEIISEASRRLPEAAKAASPGVPWQKIAGIGNVLRHEYRSISVGIIWETATGSLAELKAAVVAMKGEMSAAVRKDDLSR